MKYKYLPARIIDMIIVVQKINNFQNLKTLYSAIIFIVKKFPI